MSHLLPRRRALALVLCVSPALLQAQQSLSAASLAGTVFDPQHAALPRAAIVAVSAATGAEVRTVGDAQGRFRFALLPAGDYRVTVTVAGFGPAEYRIHLEPGGAYRLEPHLRSAT